MPSTKNYRRLHEQVAARPGAAERLAALRDQTLAEIGLYELRKALERSQCSTKMTASTACPSISAVHQPPGVDWTLKVLRGNVRAVDRPRVRPRRPWRPWRSRPARSARRAGTTWP